MPTALQKALYRPLQVVHTRLCPLCGWHGFSFLRFGNRKLPREDAQCRWCRSVERHRAAYTLMRDDLERAASAANGRGLRVLHVAPEACLQPWLQKLARGGEYLSIDLDPRKAMRVEDLTGMTLPDDSWDVVWCSHVLEHIPEDVKAMREIRRVLAPRGVAVLQVPVVGETTYENPAVRTKEDRLEHFLQEDHVRLYGLDVVDRLREAGFQVEVRRVSDLSPAVVRKHGLQFKTTNEVFVGRK